jgi:integrase
VTEDIEKIAVRDGRVSLYQKRGNKNWWCRFSLPEEGQQRVALRTPNLDEAKIKAEYEFDKARFRVRDGLAAKVRRFNVVADEWLKKLSSEAAHASPAQRMTVEKNYKDALAITTRYFKPYFGQMPIDGIRYPDVNRWFEWREFYWLNGPGAEIHRIEYVRDGRTLTRPMPKKRPSVARLRLEAVFLRQIFKQAHKWGYASREKLPVIEAPKGDANRRSDFTPDQLRILIGPALTRVQRATALAAKEPSYEHILRERRRLYAFILIALYSGLRVTELHALKWENVEGFGDAERTITLRVVGRLKKGKHRARIFDPLPQIRDGFAILRFMVKTTPKAADFVFVDDQGNQIKSFKKSLTNLLAKSGLLVDDLGVTRTAGSFRHTYATQQLIAGVPVAILAHMMGTSVQMIERHYGHIIHGKVQGKLMPDWKLAG